MVIAGIDFGNRRIGLAVSNPDQLSAYPVETIERSRSLAADLATLRARLTALEVRRIVVGLPLNMDGTVGTQARAAQGNSGPPQSAKTRNRRRRGERDPRNLA